MEKTTMGFIAALGALAATPASASVNAVTTDDILKPASVAELLEPVPNAVAVMKALAADQGKTLAAVEVAEVVVVDPHRRHHHHHRVVVVHHHHHHHHHHRIVIPH